jgi:CRP-like cAMP-binding protein
VNDRQNRDGGAAARDFLRRVPLFQDLDEGQLARLAGMACEESHPGHTLLFSEGDAVDAFYLVREGAVTVFRSVKGRPMQILGRLEPGGFFGEMGLLNRARRLASARTMGPTTLLKVAKDDLISLLADNPGLELKLRAEVIRRHGLNVSALLGLAGQRDVRIRLGVEAQIELPDGERRAVAIENLSLGGVALERVPPGWRAGQAVRFLLGPPGEPPALKVSGTVSWREGAGAGIAFEDGQVGDDGVIYRALRRFLDRRG